MFYSLSDLVTKEAENTSQMEASDLLGPYRFSNRLTNHHVQVLKIPSLRRWFTSVASAWEEAQKD